MFNPDNPLKYNRTERELQEFILFCISVPGHSAGVTSRKLNEFYLYCELNKQIPFEYIKSFQSTDQSLFQKHIVNNILQPYKLGCYKRLSNAISELINSQINLSSCTLEELESIYGIGMKTARYFLLYTRPNVQIAVLDTHIRSYLQRLGHPAPNHMPSRKQYLTLEKIFLDIANSKNKTPAELDLEIWLTYRK